MSHKEDPHLAFFPVQKLTEDCLSQYQIAQLTLHAQPTAAQASHLQTCSVCAERVASDAAANEQTAYRDLPLVLSAALAKSHKAPSRALWWLAAVPVCAALAVFVVPATSPEERAPLLKGAGTVVSTVQRNGVVTLRDKDLTALTELQPGDQLRLRVIGQTTGAVYVYGFEHEHWEAYFAGNVPQDGWLPMGLEVTAGSKTKLRVILCAQPQSPEALLGDAVPADCQRTALDL